MSTSEDEQQGWIDDMEGQEIDVFDLSNFDFMLVGTNMVGEKIRDTPVSEPFYLYLKDLWVFHNHHLKIW